MSMLFRLAAGFCIATVLAEMIIATVLAATGRLNGNSASKIVALACGIDISADRIRDALTEVEVQETPSFEEILEQRATDSLEMDLRREALASYLDHLRYLEERLSASEQRFDARREAHKAEWEQRQAGLNTNSMQELQETMENMAPRQAQEQLKLMQENGKIADVVAIIKAMPGDKRKKILNEYATPADAELLQEILRRIGEGDPDKTLIENALRDNEAAARNAPSNGN